MSTLTIAEQIQWTLQRINELVESSPMSRKDIAAGVGLTPDRMRRKLRGETTLMVTNVFAFARVFQVNPSDLMAR